MKLFIQIAFPFLDEFVMENFLAFSVFLFSSLVLFLYGPVEIFLFPQQFDSWTHLVKRATSLCLFWVTFTFCWQSINSQNPSVLYWRWNNIGLWKLLHQIYPLPCHDRLHDKFWKFLDSLSLTTFPVKYQPLFLLIILGRANGNQLQ